jgi:hypothetical protein
VKKLDSVVSSSLRAALVLGLALSLGACSRSQQITSPSSGSGRDGAGQQAGGGCPTLIGNTLATADPFITESALCSSFIPGRMRLETSGDIAGGLMNAAGPCAASDAPTINVLGGHANVVINGTAQSVTITGERLTFGALVSPGQFIEPGVVLANDAEGNVLEIIWPALNGLGAGAPIVRVQLAQYNQALVTPSTLVDVSWDLTFEQDGVWQSIQGGAAGIPLNGTIVYPNTAPVVPCPTSLGSGGTVINATASIVQYKNRRLRFEASGDVEGGIVDAAGRCAAAEVPTVLFTGGESNMLQAGTNISVTPQGTAATFGALLFPGVLLEPGIVVANDANKNVLEIIWPGLAGLGAGQPIFRTQFNGNHPWIATGKKVDIRMRFDAIGPDGQPASFNVVANNVTIPVRK